MVTPKRAEKIMKYGVDENGESLKQVKIRTILTCKCTQWCLRKVLRSKHGNRRAGTGW